MDTSEQYIKMCDCPEIQDIFAARPKACYGKWIPGDFFYRWDAKESGVYEKVADDEGYYYNDKLDNATWLPRLDQLQEMLHYEEHSSYPVSHMLKHLDEFYVGDGWYWEDDAGGISWEQLWLAFLLKEKFGKVWYDGKWVVQT